MEEQGQRDEPKQQDEPPQQDEYLKGIDDSLSEWVSPEDEKAWRDL